MYYIRIKSFPKIINAHSHGMDYYKITLPPRKNRIEICYFAEGELTCTQGKRTLHMEKYKANVNLYPEETHIFAPNYHEHRTVCFEMEYDVLDKKEENVIALPIFMDCTERCRIHDLIDEIIHTHNLGTGGEYALAGIFLELLDECEQFGQKQKETQYGNVSGYVRRAKEYVYQNLQRPLTEKEIAQHLSITPEYLCSVFKQANDVPLMTFINQLKLDRIQAVMQRENLKLYQAAEMYGYSDPNYVSRLYKKYYGKNVTDYKKESNRTK